MILLEGLSKSFPAVRDWRWWRAPEAVKAVQNLHFHARDGAITGLLGPNGAGKTTTLRMLGGLVAPDAGVAWVDGIDVQRQPHAARARLGLLGDARGLYPRLTARENILYFARLQGMDAGLADARCETLCDMLDMRRIADRRCEGFSQGERMKTALARALVHDPANVVLDEPTNGLDVMATRSLREVLRHLRSPEGGGKCIVFSTHIMQEVDALCDEVHVVHRGAAVTSGTVGALKAMTGCDSLEDAFVRLTYGQDGGTAPDVPRAQDPVPAQTEGTAAGRIAP